MFINLPRSPTLRELNLSDGFSLSDDDLDLFDTYRYRKAKVGYAVRSIWNKLTACTDNIYLHREIALRLFGDIPEGMEVDHIDRNKLNNCRGNLRLVNRTENARNRNLRNNGIEQLPAGNYRVTLNVQGKRHRKIVSKYCDALEMRKKLEAIHWQ